MSNFSRRQFMKMGLLASSAMAGFSCATGKTLGGRAARSKPNVLFIAVDDLRPQLGCYGVPQMKTPRLDALAGRGTLFEHAYCQQAVCSPSRSSLLTGRRPDTTRVFDLKTHFRTALPDVVTLPQHFKQNGYHTKSLGKVYHVGYDDPPSWSEPSWWPDKRRGRPADAESPEAANPASNRGPSWEASNEDDAQLPDGQTAAMAIEALRKLKDGPFFLAVGFLKPHLPFVAPKKYFDLYPPDTIRLADNPFPPTDSPDVALSKFGELRAYADIPPTGPIPDEKARELIRGYYAAASYTDAQIGLVLDELDRLALRDNTIVVVWGDHGWHLGDHGLWCKHTNFENATHSPLIVSAPGQKAVGTKTPGLVEFVDIYPSLCELCGLSIPDGLEGSSFASLLDKPQRPWKAAAFSQYPRSHGVMGYSMRTDRYRYTEWLDKNRSVIARELYDHQTDPDENHSLALDGNSQELVSRLSAQLGTGWRGAAPRR